MSVQWQDLHHQQLSSAQLYQLLALRNAVFIVEQQCPYQDIDGADLSGENRHLFATEQNRLLAYARLIAPSGADQPAKIGRVIVSAEARGMKLGNQLMAQAIASCQRHWPQHAIFLSAQTHLQAFYRGFGFVPIGDAYLEDDIPHIDMQRPAESASALG